MRRILLLPMACCWLLAAAQSNDVAQAERAFAQMATDSGTRKAFLHFLADSSFIFYKGEPYAALSYWKSLPERTTLLLWKPVFTGVASSGEIGFSTGPFEQRAKPGGPISESGNYNSIWAFFRVNRQFIVNYTSVKEVITWFDGKLKLIIKPDPFEEIIISRLKAGDFKNWLNK